MWGAGTRYNEEDRGDSSGNIGVVAGSFFHLSMNINCIFLSVFSKTGSLKTAKHAVIIEDGRRCKVRHFRVEDCREVLGTCCIVAYRVWGYAVVQMDIYAGLRSSCRFAAIKLGDGRV